MEQQHAKKNIAALSSVLWSAVLSLLKLVVGIATGSLGILSEALHSTLDLMAALGTLFAVRLAAKPADEDHPYGHGKVENLTALAETLLLLGTAIWVIREAVSRLLSDDPAALQVDISLWAFLVIIVSLVVDINRSAMLRRIARETNSAALEADAAHFSSDIWSSAAVLVGITGAALSSQVTPNSPLHWLLIRADVFSSLIVACIILHICKVLGSAAINNLMDKTDSALYSRLSSLMQQNMPAYPLRGLRVRAVGNTSYIEMVVGMPRELHIDSAHEIADAIEHLIENSLPGAETLVHIQPEDLSPDSPDLLIRQIALAHRLAVHSLRLLEADQGLLVFTDMELPSGAKLGAWSVPIQAFRSEVKRHLNAADVFVHIEPAMRTLPEFSSPIPENWESSVRRAMNDLHAPSPTSIRLFSKGSRRVCFVSIPADPAISVESSHEQLTLLSEKLSAALPSLARMVVVYD